MTLGRILFTLAVVAFMAVLGLIIAAIWSGDMRFLFTGMVLVPLGLALGMFGADIP